MTLNGWFQIAFMLALVVATARPLGRFMAAVLEGRATFLHRLVRPVEQRLYAYAGIDATREQSWLGYVSALLLFNAAGFVLLYAILRLQQFLPLNPQGFAGMSPHMAFNTAASFVSNTNWQAYGGETTLSYFSQMAGLTVQNFVSAATGMAHRRAAGARLSAAPMPRRSATSGSISRARTLYVLLPLSIVVALALIALGVPQNLSDYVDATTLEGAKQTHRARSRRQPGRHQAARHQRRRLLQRELGAPLREPQRLDQHRSRPGPSSRSRSASPSPSGA